MLTESITPVDFPLQIVISYTHYDEKQQTVLIKKSVHYSRRYEKLIRFKIRDNYDIVITAIMALILGKSYLSIKKLICPSMVFEETSLSVT